MSELVKRILFAVPAAILFIFLTWMGGWYFKGFIIFIGFFIQQEVMRLMSSAGNPTDQYFPYTIGLWIMLFPVLPYAFEIGLGILLLFIAIQTFDVSEESITKLSTSFFAGLYAPLGLLCLMLIRDLGTNETGFLLTLAAVLMVWGGDVFAYFGGRSFGKRKLAPSISPNKTWEGFISGYFGCFVGLAIALYAIPFETSVTMTLTLPLILLVGTFGPVGDLIESKIKRKAGVKDSSDLLPGHGGFFDRFDALLLVAPAVYIYLQLIQEFGYVSF
ncbi:MAG: phosphatidate cytidylyltransferase [Gracilimonas sp.]|uniref:phosphatidate cytidylyltransferase n=1 Tax=Gracilimonas TaxID=649462 RepID=UPI001B04C80B|nr:phosphatidate cytidylyltransferase [Gracilimonas sp.]MBO6587411.1 phosphatidate cytidylyltransferase [Gracilimonas sp.]MBO6614103.1 phosphatidate cytidylyltransferase [Gracilimonas sp.]